MIDTFRKVYSDNTTEQVKLVKNLKDAAEVIESLINKMDSCREQNIALIKLEECVMWATKGIFAKKKE